MDTFLSDVRYTLRLWARNPGFFFVAVLTLALGIGANTTMFSLLNGTVLRALPFPQPERLVTLWQGDVKEPDSLGIVSWPNFRDWKAMSRSFESLALFDSAGRGYNLTGDGEPEQVSGVRVTASFFDVLGVAPLHGRTFREEEEVAGRDRVVVLSHALWSRRFGADPALVGRTIRIDGVAYEVVGVMPPEFRMQFWSGPRQLWVPAGWTAGDHQRDSNSFIAIGRLGPGVGLAAARSEMESIARSLAAAYPESNEGETVRVVPMGEYGLGSVRRTLFTALGVVGFVLLIACVNVANLMLARAATRQRELAIRSALGAGRLRILRQLLTESVLLGLAGGLVGLAIAVWAAAALVPLLPDGLRTLPMRPLDAVTVDLRVLAFTAATSLACALLFGVAPALGALRGNLNAPLKEQARGTTGGRSRLRYGLVASEIALALVVLAGAGVLTLSLWRVLDVPPGLDPRNVLVMGISAPQEDLYYGPPGNPLFCERLAREVGGVPGVVTASAIAHLPLGGGSAGRSFTVAGRPDPGPQDQPSGAYTVACPAILRTLGIPLLEGREFEPTDTTAAPGVAIVNEAMARRYWPGETAVGKRFKLELSEDQPWLTVVGVYGGVRHFGLDREVRPSFMRPYQQAGWPVLSVVVKTAHAPGTIVNPVKAALARVAPEQPVSRIRTMEEVIGESVSPRRFLMWLLGGFAMLALTLAAVGIAGVVGYSVVQRTQEIGVRMALGAGRRDVLRLVIGHSLSWAIAGVAVGILGAVVFLRLLENVLYEVRPADPGVLATVSVVLLAVALAATWLPARRATRVDPVTALRAEG